MFYIIKRKKEMKNKMIYHSFYTNHPELNQMKEWVIGIKRELDISWCNQLIKEGHEK